VAVRIVSIALALEALWIGVGGLLALAMTMVAFEEEDHGQGVDARLVGIGLLIIAFVVAAASMWLLTQQRDRSRRFHPAKWLAVAGLANVALASFWIVMAIGQDGDPMPVVYFVAVAAIAAIVCFWVAWVERSVGPARRDGR
jgi:apolipoprotein N-acyltransferase